MKYFKYTGHPILLITLYFLLIIESEHFGGFYLLYLLMAMPTGSAFAIFGLLGGVLIFIGYNIYNRKFHLLKLLFYFLGYLMMIFSLLLFFTQKDRLNTFQTGIPTITFIIFGLCSIAFIIYSFSLLIKSISNKANGLKILT